MWFGVMNFVGIWDEWGGGVEVMMWIWDGEWGWCGGCLGGGTLTVFVGGVVGYEKGNLLGVVYGKLIRFVALAQAWSQIRGVV
ncbi:hypothetical protein QT338_11725 [Escherichia coli]|nr:hypothetical protein [Escherichia coli]